MTSSVDIPDIFPEEPPTSSPITPKLISDEQVISRRRFLGASLATVATLSGYKGSPEEQRTANAQSPFSYEGKDKNGIDHYRHPDGYLVSILYTNHNQELDPSILPDGVTDLAYDTGGVNHQSGHGKLFDKHGPKHLVRLGTYISDNNIKAHLLCPAVPGSDNEDTIIPMGIDGVATAFPAAVGGLLARDGIRDLRQDVRTNKEILQRIHNNDFTDLLTWDAAKAGAGLLLVEPVAAALSRSVQLGTLDRATEKWLQSAFARNPHLLPLRNKFLDLLHVIKLRMLMAERAIRDPQQEQHFQLVIGKTHVNVASGLERPMQELLNELDAPLMRLTMNSVTDPSNVKTIPISESSRFEKSSTPNQKPIERVSYVLYPPLYDRLTEGQKREAHSSSAYHNAETVVIGAPVGLDAKTWLASR